MIFESGTDPRHGWGRGLGGKEIRGAKIAETETRRGPIPKTLSRDAEGVEGMGKEQWVSSSQTD